MNPWTPLVAATLGWGASIVLSRAVIQNGIDTFDMLPVRMWFAMLALGAVIGTTRRFWTTSRLAWRQGTVLGVVGMGVPMALMTLALEDLPVSISGLLIALIPISTVGAAHFLVDGERFEAKSLPGLLVALAGSAVLVGFGSEGIEGVDNLWRGVVLVTAGVVLAGVGGALSRRYALVVSSDDLVLPQFAVGTILLSVALPFLGESGLRGMAGTNLLLIALIGSIGTALPFAAFLVGAAVNPASRLALTGYAVPVVAVILAVIFLGESVTLTIVVGAVLIIGGVILAGRATEHVPEPGVATVR
jgi:drug/metabolite transporter (DMT)-like permease